MRETSETSPPSTLKDFVSVTFSQALAGGLTHSGWLAGQQIDPSGREAALANHSVAPEKVKELTTRVTCGPLFDGLSPSADLQQSLESRLQARLGGDGSQEYVLTWKRWDMESGVPICALRASVRRTYGSGCGGWATPTVHDEKNDRMGMEAKQRWDKKKTTGSDLAIQTAVNLADWPTPDTAKGGKTSRSGKRKNELLIGGIVRGMIPMDTHAKTEKPAECRLNPRFSLWLMGYPDAWASCGEQAMQLCRRSPKSSS